MVYLSRRWICLKSLSRVYKGRLLRMHCAAIKQSDDGIVIPLLRNWLRINPAATKSSRIASIKCRALNDSSTIACSLPRRPCNISNSTAYSRHAGPFLHQREYPRAFSAGFVESFCKGTPLVSPVHNNAIARHHWHYGR